MTRKQKQSSGKSRRDQAPDVERLIERASRKLAEGEVANARDMLRRVFATVSATPEQRGEALGYLGVLHIMKREFDDAYRLLSEALALRADDPIIWYNRHTAAKYTMRIGQALRDLEQAAALETAEDELARYARDLALVRKLVADSLALRGPGFTLDQLIEQEELFQTGLRLMQQKQWAEAEATFRGVTAMGDCLPQPWGNIGGCLLMQQRYDEAEAALKRALEIDPDYDLARENLRMLPAIRRSGPPPEAAIRNPFDEVKLRGNIVVRG